MPANKQTACSTAPARWAAVEEAQSFGRYICAHAYTPEVIALAMHGGVCTIEHGNLMDEGAAGWWPTRAPCWSATWWP